MCTTEGPPLSAAELAALQRWVRGGGVLVVSAFANWSEKNHFAADTVGWLGINTRPRSPFRTRAHRDLVPPPADAPCELRRGAFGLLSAYDNVGESIFDLGPEAIAAGAINLDSSRYAQVAAGAAAAHDLAMAAPQGILVQAAVSALLALDAGPALAAMRELQAIAAAAGHLPRQQQQLANLATVVASQGVTCESMAGVLQQHLLRWFELTTMQGIDSAGEPTCLAYLPPSDPSASHGLTGAGRVLVCSNLHWLADAKHWLGGQWSRQPGNERLLFNLLAAGLTRPHWLRNGL